MKKIISMVLALILVISLCGCTIDVNVNYNYKEKTETRTEELIDNIKPEASMNPIVEETHINEVLPGPVAISTPMPTQIQYNWQNVKADPDSSLGFEIDPYLG